MLFSNLNKFAQENEIFTSENNSINTVFLFAINLACLFYLLCPMYQKPNIIYKKSKCTRIQ